MTGEAGEEPIRAVDLGYDPPPEAGDSSIQLVPPKPLLTTEPSKQRYKSTRKTRVTTPGRG